MECVNNDQKAITTTTMIMIIIVVVFSVAFIIKTCSHFVRQRGLHLFRGNLFVKYEQKITVLCVKLFVRMIYTLLVNEVIILTGRSTEEKNRHSISIRVYWSHSHKKEIYLLVQRHHSLVFDLNGLFWSYCYFCQFHFLTLVIVY